MQHIDTTGSQLSNYIHSPKPSLVTQAVCLCTYIIGRGLSFLTTVNKELFFLKRCQFTCTALQILPSLAVFESYVHATVRTYYSQFYYTAVWLQRWVRGSNSGNEQQSSFKPTKTSIITYISKSLLWLKIVVITGGFDITRSIPPVFTTGHAFMGMPLLM